MQLKMRLKNTFSLKATVSKQCDSRHVNVRFQNGVEQTHLQSLYIVKLNHKTTQSLIEVIFPNVCLVSP
jgi:hypothetical protein